MKILHVIPSYFPATYWGGPVHSLYMLNTALASLPGIELTVATTDSAGPKLEDKLTTDQKTNQSLFPNYSVRFFRRMAGRSTSLSLLFSLPELIRKADIIHLSAAYSFPILPTIFLCNVMRKPLVWSPCGAILDTYTLTFSPNKKIKAIWEKIINMLILPDKMALHATSGIEKEVTSKRIPRAPVVVIPRGIVVPPSFDEIPHDDDGVLRILFLSRLDPKKGLENLLDALILLDDASIRLNICGTGDPAFVDIIKNKVRQSALLQNCVNLSGEVSGQEKEKAFFNADIFILPSHSESFGIAIAEALAHGLPVIASRNTPWQGIEEYGCGLWIENDPRTLADGIRRIREMDLSLMGRKGREWMQREFSIENSAQAMLHVYQFLTGNDNG